MDADFAWDECIPDLPLDTHNLPPLNALSTSTDTSLRNLEFLDTLLTFDNTNDQNEKLPLTPPSSESDNTHIPHSLSPSATSSITSIDSPPIKNHPPSHTSATRHDTPPPTSSQSELVLELTTRLSSASSEATMLRKRVAALTHENRALRTSLDHANARLVAVAQAAAPHPSSTSPVVLGLAQVPTDVAHKISGALTISDTSEDSPRLSKKRKRVSGAAATTMACVMFMWGAFVGTPGLLKGSTSAFRSDANLPAVWKGESTSSAVAPVVNRVIKEEDRPWHPNCMRVLQQLPDGSASSQDSIDSDFKEEDVEDTKRSQMFVDMHDEAAANVVAHSDVHDRRHPEYSYVLCRDADAAVDSVKACATKAKNGEPCGQPHTISLIMPAAAAGLEDNDTQSVGAEPELAEVQCTILSVARIPSPKVDSGSKYGRVIATVPETRTVFAE